MSNAVSLATILRAPRTIAPRRGTAEKWDEVIKHFKKDESFVDKVLHYEAERLQQDMRRCRSDPCIGEGGAGRGEHDDCVLLVFWYMDGCCACFSGLQARIMLCKAVSP